MNGRRMVATLRRLVMKIEAGKFYKTRNGGLVTVVAVNSELVGIPVGQGYQIRGYKLQTTSQGRKTWASKAWDMNGLDVDGQGCEDIVSPAEAPEETHACKACGK